MVGDAGTIRWQRSGDQFFAARGGISMLSAASFYLSSLEGGSIRPERTLQECVALALSELRHRFEELALKALACVGEFCSQCASSGECSLCFYFSLAMKALRPAG